MPETHPLNLLIPACIQLLTVLAVYQYLVHRVDGVCQVKQFFRPKYDGLYLSAGLVMLLGSGFVFVKCFLYDGDGWMRAVMHAEVLIWLCAAGLIDLQEKIIPNALIGWGLAFWLVLMALEVLVGGTPLVPLLVFSGVGGLVCGGLLFVIAIIVKSALGMGDVKLFFVLGLLYGLTDAYGILLFSVLALGAASIVLLLTKKATMKTAIPMAPFVVIGFILSILAGM